MKDPNTVLMWSGGSCFKPKPGKENPDLQEAERQREMIRQTAAMDEMRRTAENAKKRGIEPVKREVI